MKKKIKHKPVKKSKQKIDVVIESLVHLEQRVKELIEEVNQLKNKNDHHYYPPLAPMPTNPEQKYWPHIANNSPPYWYNHNRDIGWDAIDKGLQ